MDGSIPNICSLQFLDKLPYLGLFCRFIEDRNGSKFSQMARLGVFPIFFNSSLKPDAQGKCKLVRIENERNKIKLAKLRTCARESIRLCPKLFVGGGQEWGSVKIQCNVVWHI